MRSSLLTRLLLSMIAVAAVAIVTTAYITTRSTTNRLATERSRSLAADLAVRDQLVGYASMHSTWDGVGLLIDELAASSGRHVVLTSAVGAPIADSRPDATATEVSLGDPAALIDVLGSVTDVSTLTPVSFDGGDGRRSAPDQVLVPVSVVDPAEPAGSAFLALIAQPTTCTVAVSPQRPNADAIWTAVSGDGCSDQVAAASGNRYADLNNDLARRVASCATSRGSEAWLATDQSSIVRVAFASPSEATLAAYRTCAASIRAEALDPLVAPPALLYLAGTSGPEASWIERAGGARIVVALLAILVAALVATGVLASGLLRPIRTMTKATRQMTNGERDARVRVRGNDELSRLGESLNAMADSIECGELQRRQLVSDVAHELRNPLANVRGYLEAAQDDVVAVDAELIQSLLDETIQLQRLVDDLQDLALADAKQLRLHCESFDVGAVIAEVVAAHVAHARQRDVTLVAVGAHSLELDADPVRIRQVIGNLIGNALKYTPPGGQIRVELSGRVDPATGPMAQIEITDTGVGIEPEHLAHVFERFARGDPSRSRETGGTGLGLAICKYLVEAHSGTITVRSEVGIGTSFTLTLPAAGPPSSPSPDQAAPSSRRRAATS